MNDYLLFMHDDAAPGALATEWGPYLTKLRASGRFDGGSAIGGGECASKSGATGTYARSTTIQPHSHSSDLHSVCTVGLRNQKAATRLPWRGDDYSWLTDPGRRPIIIEGSPAYFAKWHPSKRILSFASVLC